MLYNWFTSICYFYNFVKLIFIFECKIILDEEHSISLIEMYGTFTIIILYFSFISYMITHNFIADSNQYYNLNLLIPLPTYLVFHQLILLSFHK